MWRLVAVGREKDKIEQRGRRERRDNICPLIFKKQFVPDGMFYNGERRTEIGERREKRW